MAVASFNNIMYRVTTTVQGDDLASKLPRSQSNKASVGSAEQTSRIHGGPNSQLTGLKDLLLTSRCQISQHTFRALVDPMPWWVRAVLAAQDGPSQYLAGSFNWCMWNYVVNKKALKHVVLNKNDKLLRGTHCLTRTCVLVFFCIIWIYVVLVSTWQPTPFDTQPLFKRKRWPFLLVKTSAKTAN